MLVYNSEHKSIIQEVGELVCKSPFPSRPLFFWNDTRGIKYKMAYFKINNKFWMHGDFMKINDHLGIEILGRSDATLNPQGIRIGTSEIYNVVESIVGVEDSLVCEVISSNHITVMVLFIVLQHEGGLNQELKNNICRSLTLKASKRHVPNEIFQVSEIPYTLSGKKMELLVKNIIQNNKVDNLEGVSNPKCLFSFTNLGI